MHNTADVIARKLFDAGCRYAFGIPGGEVLTIMDALVRARIRFTLAKHENAAFVPRKSPYNRWRECYQGAQSSIVPSNFCRAASRSGADDLQRQRHSA
jgi:hypothetical protein